MRRMRGLAATLAVFVAAWTPAAAQAAIGPQQVEALDRQGATEIIVRREPGLSAAERADVRAGADVALERRSTLAGHRGRPRGFRATWPRPSPSSTATPTSSTPSRSS